VPLVVHAFPWRTGALAAPRWNTCIVDPSPLSPNPAPRLGAPPRPGRGPSRPRVAARRAAARTHTCRASTWPQSMLRSLRPCTSPPALAVSPYLVFVHAWCSGRVKTELPSTIASTAASSGYARTHRSLLLLRPSCCYPGRHCPALKQGTPARRAKAGAAPAPHRRSSPAANPARIPP
jgi:hypothetical protein